MIALTAGYHLGGIIAEGLPGRLCWARYFFAAVLVIFLPYITQPVMEITLDRFMSKLSSSVIPEPEVTNHHCFIHLRGLTSVLSPAMTSPFIIHDSLTSTAVGRIAGRFSLFSWVHSRDVSSSPGPYSSWGPGFRLRSADYFSASPLVHKASKVFLGRGVPGLLFALMLGIQGAGTSAPSESKNQLSTCTDISCTNGKQDRWEPALRHFLAHRSGFGMQSMWAEVNPTRNHGKTSLQSSPHIRGAQRRSPGDCSSWDLRSVRLYLYPGLTRCYYRRCRNRQRTDFCRTISRFLS
jgi:hypothetical protein